MFESVNFNYDSKKEFNELFKDFLNKSRNYLVDNKENINDIDFYNKLSEQLYLYMYDFTKKQNNSFCNYFVNIIIDSIDVNFNFLKNYNNIFSNNFYIDFLFNTIEEYIHKYFIYGNNYIIINFLCNKCNLYKQIYIGDICMNCIIK